MIKEIMKDIVFLGQKAELATKKDEDVCKDLEDTLKFHLEHCVGMAANMIGVNKRIIVFVEKEKISCMLNPFIVQKAKPFQAEEGCLSLDGVRSCTRYEEITVSYMDTNGRNHKEKFEGFTAQIIQHEVDHCEGIVI